MPRYTVAIVECTHGREIASSVCEAVDEWDAIQAAVKDTYGKRAYFHLDNGLADIGRYGNIARDVHGAHSWQANLLTGRVRMDVEPADESGE